MPPSLPKRRPVDVTVLEAHTVRMKLRAAVLLPETKKKTVSLPREAFVPLIQAEVGSPVPISVYRYRLLVPTAQIIRESAPACAPPPGRWRPGCRCAGPP